MLLARYRHRLPADHDMEAVRARIRARGPTWDAAPGLACKAFVIEERARGAAENAYSSLYLWFDATAAADFLAGPGFEAVIRAFGRPRTETWLPWAVRVGTATGAASLGIEEGRVPLGADLAAARAEEAGRAERLAAEPDVAAVLVGLDPAAWRVTRFVLRATPADAGGAEIAHLAAPALSARALTVPGLTVPGLAVPRDSDPSRS
ncbi:DUF4865 family protein [Methylobacterium sp. NEAU 140]|uniref:DUF4865 family protein n=1 Tax=Methylobacterium sp. NEAU 140 TaxID=3064945 RepID=UPI002732A1B7|nr:DUF4865 family protein [Methylobacterium sp. NEAU 140]MDP4026421.1 DUF4865 family protein [Methylobacterium sp. NEAU 140]